MKRVFLLLLIHAFFIGKSQNLVPNWSFEDTIKCVQHDDQFAGYVMDWTGQMAGGGLCFYTSNCSGVGYDVGVPYNLFGYQWALTGVSYSGIYTYICDTVTDTSYHDYRNYLQVMLATPLVSLTKYYITFFVNCANADNYSCSDIGAYLSDSSLVYSVYGRPKYKLTPQITNNPVLDTLKDTLHWIKISGTYKASGGEQYIIIGNFKPDSLSHIRYLGNRGTPGAYYYIDDVIVSPDSNYADSIMAVNEIRPEVGKVEVYPNPSRTQLNVQLGTCCETTNLCLYNSIGQQVMGYSLRANLTTLNVATFSDGIYYYRITSSDNRLIKADKLVIIH